MPRRRELCGSRNTATGKPCKLSKNACRYLEHRKPDKTVTPISAAQQKTPPKNTSAAQQKSAGRVEYLLTLYEQSHNALAV